MHFGICLKKSKYMYMYYLIYINMFIIKTWMYFKTVPKTICINWILSEHFFFFVSYHDDQSTIDERKFQIHVDLHPKWAN